MKRKNVAFIGSGNMAEALKKGIIDSGLFPASAIMACDIDPVRLEYLSATHGVKTSEKNEEGARACDILVLSVKPQIMGGALKSIASVVRASQLVISIAAGVKLATIEAAFGAGVPVIRAMPNGPALAGSGITAIARGTAVTDSDVEDARALLGAVGEVIETGEEFMDAVTAVSGSGPAYFFYLIEALADAARAEGFSEEEAGKLAIATAIGSMRWLEETGSSPHELRKKVTSPGGTTEAALKVLQKGKFKELIADAVKAAVRRSRELGGD